MFTIPWLPTQESSLSPPVKLTTLHHEGKGIYVAREDLLPGGTKQRAALFYVNSMAERGYHHFIYASPFCGFAQVALAYVCKILQVGCTIVAESDPHCENESGKHEYTRLAEHYGAEVVLVDNLRAAEEVAGRICQDGGRSLHVPLGFDCPEFKIAMKNELRKQWQRIVHVLAFQPRALWLPVGSGTLAGTFAQIVGVETALHCVNVHVLREDDPRIQAIRTNPRVTYYRAPMPFAEAAQNSPAIPSNLYYDAKLWAFIAEKAQDGDVWWNVGR